MEGGVEASMLAQLKRLSDTNAAHEIATIAATVAARGTGYTNDHAIDASSSSKSIGDTDAGNWSKSRGCWEKLPESGQHCWAKKPGQESRSLRIVEQLRLHFRSSSC